MVTPQLSPEDRRARSEQVSCADIVDALGRRHRHRAHLLDLVSPTPGRLLFGPAVTISFFPTKNLGGFGDGGLILTPREDVAERCRTLRFHGSKDKVDFELVGYNSRLDEVQAALLRVLLKELPGFNDARRAGAEVYRSLGLGSTLTVPADEPGHVYHLFVCRSPERDRIRAALSEQGIGNAQYYPPPLHLQPALAHLGHKAGDLPETEQVAADNFSVPLWAGIDLATQERVVDAVRAAVGVRSA